MFDIKIIMPERQEQKEIEYVCRMLWSSNFDDTESYIEYYFNNRWHKSVTVILDNVSMLHLNPYKIKLKGIDIIIYYIVGVCTLKEYRRCGYMNAVLRFALEYMYSMDMPFTYLMPASESIYRPYGFNGIYPVRAWDGSFEMLMAKIEKDTVYNNIYASKYDILTDYEREKLFKYAEKKLSQRFSCYVVHDGSYFEELYKGMLACSGGIVVFWDRDRCECIGYVVYLCEDFNRIDVIESVFEYGMDRVIISYLEKLGCANILLYETAFWNLKTIEVQKDYLMARIVNLKAFARYLPSGQDIWLDITDNIISKNNGKWHIVTKGIDTICDLCENDDSKKTQKYTKCTIEELGEKYLTRFAYYMNELV